MFSEEFFRLQRETTWKEIFTIWRIREEAVWRQHHLDRGFATWEEWRLHQLAHIGLQPEGRYWRLYHLAQSEKSVPQLLIGAYRGWQQYQPEGAETVTFAEVAEHPKLPDNQAMQRLLEFPPQTRRIFGLRFGHQVVIRDGTHHCAALALAARLKRPFGCTTTIALTNLASHEEEIFVRASNQRHALIYGAH